MNLGKMCQFTAAMRPRCNKCDINIEGGLTLEELAVTLSVLSA